MKLWIVRETRGLSRVSWPAKSCHTTLAIKQLEVALFVRWSKPHEPILDEPLSSTIIVPKDDLRRIHEPPSNEDWTRTMDPITAIGLLASISSLIKASKSALELLKTLKDAERDLSELINSMTVFEESLKGFDRVLRSRQAKHNISEEILRNAIDDGFTTMRDLEKRLTQVQKTENSALRRIKWMQHKSGFESLDERIKGHCAQLHSFVSLAHMLVFLPSKLLRVLMG